MKKPTSAGASQQNAPPVQTCSVGSSYPCLYAFLSDSRWDDGSARECGTLLLCFAEGRFRGCLTDKALRRQAWLSGETLADLLASVEGGLEHDSLEWRAWKPFVPGKR